jgi:hypothetical protein
MGDGATGTVIWSEKTRHGGQHCTTVMKCHTSLSSPYRYRLIDSSLEGAIVEANAWVEPVDDPNDTAHAIGMDVSTGDGNWRTCCPPGLLLCPMACQLSG